MPQDTGIKRLNGIFQELVDERSSFISHYKELAEFVQPRRGRFLLTDRNKGDKRYQKIINSHASWALKVARAGLLSGVMSPATEWFVLGVDDPELTEYKPVKEYLYEVQGVINRVFNSSNLYAMAPVMLGELVQFGTGCMYQENDFENVSRFYAHTVGSYLISTNARFEVDTVFREWQLPCRAIVKEFGIENVSREVKNAYNQGAYSTWFTVRHCVMPNEDYREGASFSKFFKFKSVYWEPGQSDNEKYLRVSGYKRFPYYVPRWDVTGEDIYGTDCPGMTALGDVKGLQMGERRQAQAIDLMIRPMLHGPGTLKNVPIDAMPGGATIYDTEAGQEKGLRPVHEVKPDVQALRGNLVEIQKRIERAYYVEQFLAISNMDGVQPRNQLELSQRNQERLLQLGPVLMQLFGGFLNPLIDNTFDRLVELDRQAGGGVVLPVPPPELQGREIRPEYISTLAVAQRAASLGNIERLATFEAGLIGAGLSDGKKINGDQMIDEYAERLRVPPSVVRPDDEVAQLRKQEQEAQQQANTLAAAQQAADTAKTASETRTSDGKSVLDGFSEGLQKIGGK